MEPELSVIVPVYNGEKTLSLCLDSLMALDYPKEELEIIAVDNNSTDATKEIIQRYPVRYVFEPVRGRAKARNAGIKAARGDYIAFTDADCIVDKNWLKELIKGFTSDDVVACGGKILASDTKNWIAKYIEETGMLAQEGTQNDDIEHNIYRIVTANAIFRKDIFEKIGPFDERLITSEDTEMGFRISLYGYQMKYIPQAIVYHQHIKSFKKFCLWNFNFGRADYVYYRKYQKIFDFRRRWECLFQFTFSLFIFYGRSIYKLLKNQNKPNRIFLKALGQTCYIVGELRSCLRDIFIDKFGISFEEANLLSNSPKKGININYNGSTWAINKAVFGVPEGNSVMLYHCYKNNYFMLDGISAAIWRFFLSKKPISDIIPELSKQYNISAPELEQDILSFIKEMEKEDIILKNT